MSRSKEERMPPAGQSSGQTRGPEEPPVSRETLSGQSYYSRESYREYPRRSTSRQPPEESDERARYDREGRPASFYNRAHEPIYRARDHRHPAPRYEEDADRYGGTAMYRDQSDRYRPYENERDRYGSAARYEDQAEYPGLDSGRYRSYERQPYYRTHFAGNRAGNYSEDPYERDYDHDNREQRAWTRANNLRCRDIMSKSVTTCSPATSLREVADMMDDEDVGSIPVVENARLVGIVTDRDIVCRIMARELDTRSSNASDAMTEEIVTSTPDEPVIEAVHKMAEFMIRRLPVVDHGGRLRGMISIADVALEAELDQELARALEQISHPTPHKSRHYAAWR